MTKGTAFGWACRYCSIGVGWPLPGPLATTAWRKRVEIRRRGGGKTVEAVHHDIDLAAIAQAELDREPVRTGIGIGIRDTPGCRWCSTGAPSPGLLSTKTLALLSCALFSWG